MPNNRHIIGEKALRSKFRRVIEGPITVEGQGRLLPADGWLLSLCKVLILNRGKICPDIYLSDDLKEMPGRFFFCFSQRFKIQL